jgi:hypothetical protein
MALNSSPKRRAPTWYRPIKGVYLYTELVDRVAKSYGLSETQSETLKSYVIQAVLAEPSSSNHLRLCDPLTGKLIDDASNGILPRIGTSLKEFDRWLVSCGMSKWQISRKVRTRAKSVKTATASTQPFKKVAIVNSYSQHWPDIVNDFSNASRNGLSKAARVKGGWNEAETIRWAIRRGRLVNASPAELEKIKSKLNLRHKSS